MADYASYLDVERVLARPLAGAEVTAAQALLQRVSALMRLEVPNLDARVQANPDFAVVVRGYAADAVKRVLQNPDGKVQESIDDYSYRRADAVADGVLYLTPAELAGLRAGGVVQVERGAFTIRPGRR